MARKIERLGRRFFWIRTTGNIVAQRNEMDEGIESTKEEDFAVYIQLKDYNINEIEMTTFEPGQYADDFAQAKSWKFDPETGNILFSHPDPSETEPTEPVYRKPLSVEVDELKASDIENKQAIAELTMMIATPMGGDGR